MAAFDIGDKVWFQREGSTPFAAGDPADKGATYDHELGGRGKAAISFTKGLLGLGANEGVPQIKATDFPTALDSEGAVTGTFPPTGAKIGVRGSSNPLVQHQGGSEVNEPAMILGTVQDDDFDLLAAETFKVAVDGGPIQTATILASAAALLTGSTTGPFNFVSGGQTLIVTIDGGSPQTITVAAGVAAIVTGSQSGPFNFSAGGSETLIINVNGSGNQTFTFADGAFITPAAGTIDEVLAVVQATLTGAVASKVGNTLRITSNKKGAQSTLVLGNGTANTILGFTNAQSVTGTGDFNDYAAAAIAEVVTKFNFTGATESNSASALRITSNTLGNASQVAIGAGTANAILGFTTSQSDLGDGSFPNYATITPAHVATWLNAGIDGLAAVATDDDEVLLVTISTGADSSLLVSNGTANTKLGFTNLDDAVGTTQVLNPDNSTSGVYDDPTALAPFNPSADDGRVVTNFTTLDPNSPSGQVGRTTAGGAAGPELTGPNVFGGDVIDVKNNTVGVRTPSAEEGRGTIIEGPIVVAPNTFINGVRCSSGEAYWVNWGTANASNPHRTKWNNKMRTMFHAAEELVDS